jgi:amino acid permease
MIVQAAYCLFAANYPGLSAIRRGKTASLIKYMGNSFPVFNMSIFLSSGKNTFFNFFRKNRNYSVVNMQFALNRRTNQTRFKAGVQASLPVNIVILAMTAIFVTEAPDIAGLSKKRNTLLLK